MTSVVTSAGQSSALSSATASSAMRGALAGSSMARMASKPPVTCWPPDELGQLRTCCSDSLRAIASIPAPASVSSCSIRAPSLEAKVLRSLAASIEPSRTAMPLTAAMAASASNRMRSFSSTETANGSSATGVT